MDKEKQSWLSEIGIQKFNYPVTYFRTDGRMLFYTNKYLENTPIEILRMRLVLRYGRNENLPSTAKRLKVDWLKEAGFKPFIQPQIYYIGSNHTYSADYIENTPLNELKAKFDKTLIKNLEIIIDDADIKSGETLTKNNLFD